MSKRFKTTVVTILIFVICIVGTTAGLKIYLDSQKQLSFSDEIKPISYSQFQHSYEDKDINITEINFRNQILSYKYPNDFVVKSDIDQKNESIEIFYAKKNDINTLDEINYIIKCNQENRINPEGICRESTIAPIEIYITKIMSNDSVFKDLIKDCEKQIIDNTKVIYSCWTSSIGGLPESRYYFQLNDLQLNASITVPLYKTGIYDYMGAIKLFIESFGIK